MKISHKFLKLMAFLVWITVPQAVLASSDTKGSVVKFYGLANANVISNNIASKITRTNIDLTGYDCFELPVLDPASGKKQGVGVDCLRPIDTAGDAKGEGLQMEAITFFFFKNGTLVNHGCTSVRPFFEGVGDTGVTHLTGSIGPSEFGALPSNNAPEACKVDQGIIYSSGAYRGSPGSVRLSGAVNLSNANNGQIKFSCLFVLNFNKAENN